ncbi:MAG: hypothetical protein MK170_06700 [Candidatus Thalassarchaeum sp.]|nr:hypothetical protein [Candidatus Thalassarchaeum sp.]
MKWDSPPLWPVAVPSLLGFVLACSPLRSYKFEALSFLSTPEGQDSILTPMVCLILLSGLLYFSPEELGSRRELISGALVAILFGVLPQGMFFVWFIPVVLFWVAQSTYIWKRNYPPFRIGIWLGSGAVSGLFTGGIFAHFFL